MEQLRGWVSVKVAAQHLGISPERVRDLVATGHLAASRPGRELLVRSDSVAHRAQVVQPQAGRPWSARMAWAMLAVASGARPEWVSSAELLRVRRYAKRPLSHWPRLLAARTVIHQVRMLPAVMRRVRSMPEVSAGGIEAAVAHGANLISPVEATLDLYASADVFQRVRSMRGIRWGPEEPNVVLRILPDLPASAVAAVLGAPVVPIAAAAADLMDEGDERAVLAAAELMRMATVAG